MTRVPIRAACYVTNAGALARTHARTYALTHAHTHPHIFAGGTAGTHIQTCSILEMIIIEVQKKVLLFQPFLYLANIRHQLLRPNIRFFSLHKQIQTLFRLGIRNHKILITNRSNTISILYRNTTSYKTEIYSSSSLHNMKKEMFERYAFGALPQEKNRTSKPRPSNWYV